MMFKLNQLYQLKENIMSFSIFRAPAMAIAALILTPASAVAQENLVEKAEEVTQQAEVVQDRADALTNDLSETRDDRYVASEEEGGFDWGLLGLLGLLGLAGLFGNKKDDARIHVDARHDNRP